MYDGDSDDDDDDDIVGSTVFALVEMSCSMFDIHHNVMFKPYSMFDRVCSTHCVRTFKCHQAEAWWSGLQNRHRVPPLQCRPKWIT